MPSRQAGLCWLVRYASRIDVVVGQPIGKQACRTRGGVGVGVTLVVLYSSLTDPSQLMALAVTVMPVMP